ncbi:SDR family NAD(P)-dependent oxidoreductase [Streptomyces fulvorobeus]|uniref:NAD(P)-dependent dehydrogenase (Short-subunit alcohol dehydrogenase family) n=1 Tax=Streptomyces fulvorobeus TaxID=284028 RepID=A0A7J0CHK6_9ACTN|nr:SDR family NAD(P)-dependent oxidoreductase [Streptomyces fulvorobeus]NYE44660.1 NAD(P)-dependent dehydrogenase (short-subunit alcohol dehydrogenase family) [Streptomyces fulvorobeus]GFN01207.1 short-chain dehydrogenase [Streptomyces fulvorobeus]
MPSLLSDQVQHGRTAFVTVADMGIGRAIAERLAEVDMTVYLGSRTEMSGKDVEQVLHAAGRDVHSAVVDPDDIASLWRVAERIERHSGQLDVLVNVLGLTTAFSVEKTASPDDDVRAVFDANVNESVRVVSVTEALLPLLRKSGRARVVNVSSAFRSGGRVPARLPSAVVEGGLPEVSGSVSPRTAVEALTLQYAGLARQDGVLVSAVCLDAEAGGFGDGPDASFALLQAASVPVRLATLADGELTATSTDCDGVRLVLSNE